MNSRRGTCQMSKIDKTKIRKTRITDFVGFIYIFVRKVYNSNTMYFHIAQAKYFAIKGVTNMKNINYGPAGDSDRMDIYTKTIKNDNGMEIAETGNDKEAAFIEFRFTDFRIFPIVMKDENICRKFLELILGKKIGAIYIYDDEARVLDITSEKSILIAPHLRGVRLDVFVAEENAWYDIEMQCQTEPELPKRSRLYQAEIDVENIASGAGYSELKPSYIIFICMFDPFGNEQAQRSRIEGEKTGRIETERDIARKMLAKKLDIRLIKEITGLTEEEIKKL